MAENNDAIRFLGDINSAQRWSRRLALAAVAVSAAVCVAAVALAFSYARSNASRVYVLDQGAVLEARRAANDAQRDLEVMDHVTRFHELFYNISPNVTTINQNVNRALELADESAYRYFNDLKEQRYYSKLIDINATQQIYVDSVVVDIMSYPYRASVHASLYVLRESTISLYSLDSECTLTEVERSTKNPHGLMIHDFYAARPQLVETKERNR